MIKATDPIYRFMDKIRLTPNGCWIWTGAVNGFGYAHLHTYVRGKPERAHVWIWQLINGQKPEGMELHHMCQIRHCVNPSHLRLVTRWEHMQYNRKTTCKRGHPFDYIDSEGKQSCHICEAMTANLRYHKRKEFL